MLYDCRLKDNSCCLEWCGFISEDGSSDDIKLESEGSGHFLSGAEYSRAGGTGRHFGGQLSND